jgi:hypothetical protein
MTEGRRPNPIPVFPSWRGKGWVNPEDQRKNFEVYSVMIDFNGTEYNQVTLSRDELGEAKSVLAMKT